MDNQEKFVKKLLRETQEDNAKWKENSFNITPVGEERITGKAYTTTIDNECLRIYLYESKYYRDEDDYVWVEGAKLDLIDSKGLARWTFSGGSSLMDLYKAVQYKTENVDSFISKYLSSN